MSAKIDMDKIVVEVKANRLLLDGCAGHDFSQPIDRHSKQPIAAQVVFCDWRCTRCGGWVDGIARGWYNKGVAHEQARVAAAMA